MTCTNGTTQHSATCPTGRSFPPDMLPAFRARLAQIEQLIAERGGDPDGHLTAMLDSMRAALDVLESQAQHQPDATAAAGATVAVIRKARVATVKPDHVAALRQLEREALDRLREHLADQHRERPVSATTETTSYVICRRSAPRASRSRRTASASSRPKRPDDPDPERAGDGGGDRGVELAMNGAAAGSEVANG